jgi:hypothetical protein
MNSEEMEIFRNILEKLEIILGKVSDCEVSGSDSSYKMIIYLVPIFGIVFGCTLLFFIFYWWYRQRMELIRSGQYRPAQFDLRAYAFFLGLLLTFTGLVLSIVFIIVLGKSTAILGGLVPFAVGLSLLTFYKFQK